MSNYWIIKGNYQVITVPAKNPVSCEEPNNETRLSDPSGDIEMKLRGYNWHEKYIFYIYLAFQQSSYSCLRWKARQWQTFFESCLNSSQHSDKIEHFSQTFWALFWEHCLSNFRLNMMCYKHVPIVATFYEQETDLSGHTWQRVDTCHLGDSGSGSRSKSTSPKMDDNIQNVVFLKRQELSTKFQKLNLP